MPKKSTKRKLRLRYQYLLDTLKQIRELGYASSAALCTETVLACICISEQAIAEVGEV